METLQDTRCPTCGSIESVHGDCLVCNSPLAARPPSGARSSMSVATRELGRTEAVAKAVEAVINSLDGRFPAEAVERHLGELPASYVSRTPPQVIGQHIALVDRAAGQTAVEHSELDGVDQITIVTSDRPGILSALAGTLAAHRVNILGGAVHTNTTGTAIDVLSVARSEQSPASWQEICSDVAGALDGRLVVDEVFARALVSGATPASSRVPTTVYVDNASSDRFSKVEVNAADRVGLLYVIARAIADQGLDIHLAQVETLGTTTVDTFYVQRKEGGRVDDTAAVESLRRAIIEAVDALD